MDLAATQLYEDEDEDFPFTQEILNTLEEEELVQVGTLSINSTDYPIKRGITKIGRFGTCDIVLNDMTVSKIHAEIEASQRQGSTWICDLNSSNKTKLNNLTLRPTRSYELKDGSVIEFGGVRATYRTYCPADNIVIPETPAPSRQKIVGTIIPNTPDSSLNNSSGVDDDGSVILGTQKDEENSVFRRPQVPQQRYSTSFDKKNTSSASSMNESDNSHIATVLQTSENHVSIFDVETQKFEEGCKTTASNSIHDTETQRFFTDLSEHLVEANAKTCKQLPRLNVRDETAGSSITDIHDVETQNYMDDVNKMGTQKSKVNIRDVTETKLTSDIHDVETQNYIGSTDGDGSDIQKSVKRTPEMGKNKSRERDLAHVGRNIHDLETQRFDNERAAEDISDLETQLELDGIARHKQGSDVFEIETQLEADGIANETSDDRTNKDKDKDDDTTKDETNQNESVTKSSNSRSSSPGSLNLSSPGVDEDCPSSLNQSDHLLESSDLLAFFGEDISKQEEARATPNASTPKPFTKLNSNAEYVSNASDNEEDNDEDIFNVPTQRISRNFEALLSDSETDEENVLVMNKVPKRKRGKPLSEEADDDSETDAEEYLAELAEKQRESSGSSNRPRNESVSNSRNDPGTSVESEDMFDAQTQRLNDPTTKDTSNSSTNQLQKASKINEAVETDEAVEASEVDTASTQNINNVDQDNRTNTPTPNINNLAPTQLISSRETFPNIATTSKDFSSTDNQNDVDDITPTQIINVKLVDCCAAENLDCEDIDYELAPTQVIDEIEDKERKNSTNEKTHENLNDTLEQKLNEMFDDVSCDVNNDYEMPHMSTQYLEDILESSHDDSVNKSIAGDGDIGSVSQKQFGKKNRASRDQRSDNLPDIEANAHNIHKAKTDSQNSDTYFSTITTRRKRNILRDTQELVDSAEDVTLSRQDANSSRASEANKEKAMDDNIDMGSNKKRKKISKTKNKSDAITETLNDDNMNKTISNENNERSLRSSKSMKQKDGAASETRKRVLGTVSAKVDDAEENSLICTPCPSGYGQRAQTSYDYTTLYESDDDILTRLPAVKISGTLSNPASPSASSTSTVRSARSKRRAARGKQDASLTGKSLHKRDVENSGKNNKPSVDRSSISVLDFVKTNKISGLLDASEDSDTDSDNETNKRFRQMANRILSKRQNKGNKKSERSSPNVTKDRKQSTNVGPKSPPPSSSRVTRHSNSQNDQSSRVLQREARAKNATGSSTEPETESVIAKRKTSLNVIEEGVEQASSKKRKTAQVAEECPVSTRCQRSVVKITLNRQSPNILEYFTKTSSCGSSLIIKNTKSSEYNKAAVTGEIQQISLGTRTDANVDSERSNMKRTRRIINDSQDTTCVNDATADKNSKKNKPANMKETKTEASQMQDKVLKVILSPIKSPLGDESQEVERIMARGSSNAQDKNLSIRGSSNAKMFQRALRTRSRKRHNADIKTDSSVLTENSVSSEIGDSDNMPSDDTAPKAKRGRSKGPIPPLPEAQVPKKKEIFKKPTHINQNSTSSILDSSAESTIGESSQSSTESDASTSSRLSRSKAAAIRKREKMEMSQNTRRLVDDNSSSRLNTSVKITSLVSTPSRTRRSTSVLSNSTPSAMRHKVLFTGLTEDYSKIVNTLGGSKVEDPAKCTVLVTDKVRRTYKFLCALAKGIPIVMIDWLRDSKTATRFLDWENYILKDPAAEAKFGFRLRKSLNKAKEKRLLDGCTVVLTPGVAPPPTEELKDMVMSCGGKALLRPPIKWPERAVVVSREEDLPNARKFLAKAPKTVTVQSTEFILTGILRQETDFDKYKLI